MGSSCAKTASGMSLVMRTVAWELSQATRLLLGWAAQGAGCTRRLGFRTWSLSLPVFPIEMGTRVKNKCIHFFVLWLNVLSRKIILR